MNGPANSFDQFSKFQIIYSLDHTGWLVSALIIIRMQEFLLLKIN